MSHPQPREDEGPAPRETEERLAREGMCEPPFRDFLLLFCSEASEVSLTFCLTLDLLPPPAAEGVSLCHSGVCVLSPAGDRPCSLGNTSFSQGRVSECGSSEGGRGWGVHPL